MERMIHFIYKTIHQNNRYYIGRHSTTDVDDGYLGSGRWVESIEDKTTLKREIIEYSDSVENLKILEQKYIDKHFGKANCMNWSKGSCGLTSEEASILNKKRLKAGTHTFSNREFQLKSKERIISYTRQRVKDGSLATKSREIYLEKSKNGNQPLIQKLECPHCGIITTIGNIKRWHYDNCKKLRTL